MRISELARERGVERQAIYMVITRLGMVIKKDKYGIKTLTAPQVKMLQKCVTKKLPTSEGAQASVDDAVGIMSDFLKRPRVVALLKSGELTKKHIINACVAEIEKDA